MFISSIAGPSTLRSLVRVRTVPPLRQTAAFSSAATLSMPESKRSAHALAHTVDQPSGFEGMPAPAYVEEKKARPGRKVELKSKRNAITMTPAALDRLRALTASPDDPKLLRIGVKTRGCAGMAYHLDYVSPPGGKFDEVVEQDGVRVLIDSKALFSIIGSQMDWRDNRLSAGFVFDNPNIEDTCGCGESFNIRV